MKRWIPLWIIPVITVFSVGTVWLRLKIIRTTYAIHEADRNLAKTRHERELLLLKVAALRSPKRLENLARHQFGLVQPTAQQLVYLQKNSSKKD
jgi:cell division protein FtsL